MYIRKVILLIIMTLVISGCTRIDNNVDNVVSTTIMGDIDRVNTVSTGYELYIPMGVMQLVDNEYNQKLKIKDTYVYLYVDTVSYYYKNSLNYKVSNNYNYYYREIRNNNKVGYVGINKLDDGCFFVEIVYNYAKIEFYSDEDKMPFILANSLIIVNSVKYNDNLIKNELDSSTNDGREVAYELDKPDGSESTFSQYLQEFVENVESEVVLPDAE